MFNYQIVVVNDGSVDNTLNILRNLEDEIGNLVVLTQENLGVSAARYTGIYASECDYLTFLDADDYAETDYLQTLYLLIKKHNADVATSRAIMEGRPVEYNRDEEWIWTRDEAIQEFFIHKKLNGVLWCKMFRKDIFLLAVPNHKMVIYEDSYLVWQIIQKCDRIVRINAGLVNYVYDNVSLTRSRYSMDKCYATWILCQKIVNDCRGHDMRKFLKAAIKFRRKWCYSAIKAYIKSLI